MYKIFIATSSFATESQEPLRILKSNNYDIKVNHRGRKLSTRELLLDISDCDAVIAGTENYSEDIINNLSHLKVISRLGVWMDNVNISAAEKKNIKVFKTNT